VPDPRQASGRRDAWPYLLTCLVAALLCTCNAPQAVEQWGREQQALLAQVFGPLRHRCPCGSRYRRRVPRWSVEHLEGALASWMRGTRPAEDTEPVAVDGKTGRGAAPPAARSASAGLWPPHHAGDVAASGSGREDHCASRRPSAGALCALEWAGVYGGRIPLAKWAEDAQRAGGDVRGVEWWQTANNGRQR
jgi:hypothetical protein